MIQDLKRRYVNGLIPRSVYCWTSGRSPCYSLHEYDIARRPFKSKLKVTSAPIYVVGNNREYVLYVARIVPMKQGEQRDTTKEIARKDVKR
jgi:hypothetical protein